MKQEASTARFFKVTRSRLENILKPIENEVRTELRDWSLDTLNKSQGVDRTAAQVIVNACDALDDQ